MGAIFVALLAVQVHAGDGGFHPNAPEQTRHFAPLLGTWEISQRTLKRGATDPSDPASWIVSEYPKEWRFYTILNGHAVQDDFISPASWVDVPESQRSYGTNIRVFNEKKGKWEMAWISSTAREVWKFTATSKEGEIVMRSVDLDPPRRNFFHSFEKDAFSWRQEWTFDGGETWVPVVYIEAKRVK
ncbi:MAG: hypothetical protein P8Y95_00455 [Gammaproteobacteria bacterium]